MPTVQKIPKEYFKKIVKIFENIPLPIHQIYFNYHFENARFFSGTETEFDQVYNDLIQSTEPIKIYNSIAYDTYINYESDQITKHLLNLRIRSYDESKNLTDLIALFNAKRGNENVLVARLKAKGSQYTFDKIIKHLNKHFKATKSFTIVKTSDTLVIKNPELKGKDKVGEYYNISFDQVKSVKIKGKSENPKDVFGFDKIIEIEWNKDTSNEILQKYNKFVTTHPLYTTRTSPKKYKKSVMVNRWIDKNLLK